MSNDDPLAQAKQRTQDVLLERSIVVALLARLAQQQGWTVGITTTAIPGWKENWHGCCRIDLPTGQVSWHYRDDQARLFEGLPPYPGDWDGHDTELKYERVLALIKMLAT